MVHLGGGHLGGQRVPREGCQNWPLICNSGMARPIVTKFGLCLETKQRYMLHMSRVGYIYTCAHADSPPFLCLGNGWTDCAEFWYVVRDLVARRCTDVTGGVQAHLRTCASLFRISGTA